MMTLRSARIRIGGAPGSIKGDIKMHTWINVKYDPKTNKVYALNPSEQKLIPYDRWTVWMDRAGRLEKCRLKKDSIDHFYPETKALSVEDVFAVEVQYGNQ